MTRREIILACSGFMVALLLVGGGLLWHNHQQNQKKALASSQKASDASDSAGGLSVSGGASDLGQLSPSGQSKSSSGGDSSSSSGGGNGIDTSKFAEYEKYKDSKDALFGDIQKGTGADLTAGKKATLYYKGWLTNGTLIDQSPVSSSGQPQAFTFTLGDHTVIPGWEEAIYGMKAGGTRLMIIPPAVGYGAQGKGLVPPNAVLVFTVQLVSVQ